MKRGKPLKRTEFKRSQKRTDSGTVKPSAQRRSKPRLRQVSPKRASERQKRQEVRLAALQRAGNLCEARFLVVPGVQHCDVTLDVDEIIARSAWSAGYLELGNVQVLCRAHHDWKHAHPDHARRLGLTRQSWERPEPGQPVELRVW